MFAVIVCAGGVQKPFKISPINLITLINGRAIVNRFRPEDLQSVNAVPKGLLVSLIIYGNFELS